MRKYFYLILFVICILPIAVFAEGTSPNETFAGLKGEVYSNTSILETYSEPSDETIFELEKPTRITGIWTYHWDVSDYSGATIKLVNIDTDVEYGPWNVETDSGSGRSNVNWYVFPNAEIPAGRYKLVDSHNDTWSYTFNTNNKGMAIVKGIQHIGDVTIDGSSFKPVVGGTPKNLVPPIDANYEIKGIGWTSGTAVFEKGKYYKYSVAIVPKEGYEFKEGDTFTIEGVNWDTATIEVGPDAIYFAGRIDVYDEYYNYILGANFKSKDTTEFKFEIDADYDEFEAVYVDGSLVPNYLYEVSKGSTIIEFKPEYIEYLSIDEHRLNVVFTNGVAKTKFTKLSNSVPEDENPSDTGTKNPGNDTIIKKDENNIIITEDENPTTPVVNNPQTGDNVVLYIVIGLMSVIGITGATIYTKKRFN